MAEKKQAMGDDPLSWLADEDKASKDESAPKATKRKRVRRSSAKTKPAKVKTEAEYLEESFAAIAPQGEAIARRFYERLFERYPETQSLFEGVSVNGQEKKLLASLVLLVQNVQKPDVLHEYLTGLGARHMHYGISASDYPKVIENLLTVLEEFAGELWTSEVSVAWENTLKTVTDIMLDAYEPMEAGAMMMTDKQSEDQNQELLKMSSVVNGAMTAIMMIDRDFNITYVNDATVEMLKEHEETLRQAFPGFSAEGLVGKNIDSFHKNPAHQRQLLADPNNLPYSTNIEVGPLSFNLNVTAIMDPDNNYIGTALEWQDNTEARNKIAAYEGQLEAINKSMGVISFTTDGIITDINENFLSVVGYSKEEVIGKHHRIFVLDEVSQSQEYIEFWAKLKRGEFDANQYERVGKGGKQIWLQASYNPILDLNGNPVSVIKYATDITEQTQLQETVVKILTETGTVMNAMAEGALTEKIAGEYDGNFAKLKNAINSTVDKIAETVTEISETAVSISTAATEISRGNVDLSSRTEQQASSLEETASSMEELTSTVRQNSDNASQANQLAANAREQAEKGGSVIKNAIDAMAEISTASKKVADIIGVIDEIAFQTNLLALNAAVEAARAGEQGRGFAVVASEVRNLAQRSAAAAKEIKELINDSGEKVKEGSMLVDESGRTLEDIVAGAKKVGDIISEIAAAGAEQTSGITQVNLAVGQMDEMTQQNAALVEQAAAASESLDEQGKTLQRLISFFDTGVEAAAQVAAPTHVAPEPVAKPVSAAPAPVARPVASDDDEWDDF